MQWICTLFLLLSTASTYAGQRCFQPIASYKQQQTFNGVFLSVLGRENGDLQFQCACPVYFASFSEVDESALHLAICHLSSIGQVLYRCQEIWSRKERVRQLPYDIVYSHLQCMLVTVGLGPRDLKPQGHIFLFSRALKSRVADRSRPTKMEIGHEYVSHATFIL